MSSLAAVKIKFGLQLTGIRFILGARFVTCYPVWITVNETSEISLIRQYCYTSIMAQTCI